MNGRAVIFVNGYMRGEFEAEPGDFMICCDGGLRHARRLGVTPNLLIGDLDSVDEADLRAFPGLAVEKYPIDKDQTDLELCLDKCAALGLKNVVILGAVGGRPDHLLANLHAALYALNHGVNAELRDGGWRAAVIKDCVELAGAAGDTVSLIPLTTAVENVTTAGLRYPLIAETLAIGSSRSVSNEMTRDRARVTIGRGRLAVFHQFAREPLGF